MFAANCALCHGADGRGAKANGKYAFPPLWGRDSYNGGAGMHRVETAAAFIQANMPLGKPNTLTEQQASHSESDSGPRLVVAVFERQFLMREKEHAERIGHTLPYAGHSRRRM